MAKKSYFRGKVSSNAERQSKGSSGFGYINLPKGLEMFKPEPGKTYTLDFIPYKVTSSKHPDRDEKTGTAVEGSLWYRLPIKIHRNIGSANDTVLCPTSIGKKCSVCEVWAKRRREGAEKEELQTLRASERNLYIVIPLDSEKHDKKPYLFDISQSNFQSLLNEELSENPENEIFPDLEEGLSIKVRFGSKTMGTGKPFAEARKIEFKERKKSYSEDLLEDIPSLDKLLKVLSYEELDAKFLEMEEETDPDEKIKHNHSEEEDEKPERRERKSSKEDNEDDDKKEKKSKKEEPEEDELTFEELSEKSFRSLGRVIKDKGLKIDPEDYEDDTKGLCRAIAKKLGIEIPEKKSKKEEEDDEPKSSKKSSKEDDNECPKGHVFGKDCEKFPKDCETCNKWDACIDAKK